jgi:hypothetical protein
MLGRQEGRGFAGCGKPLTADNHPGAHGATPPQMRRGGAPSAGVVLTSRLRGGVDNDSAKGVFHYLFSPVLPNP